MTRSGKVSPLIILGIPTILGCAGVLYLRAHPETVLAQQLEALKGQVQSWTKDLAKSIKKHQWSFKKKRPGATSVRSEAEQSTASSGAPDRQTTLYLTNAGEWSQGS